MTLQLGKEQTDALHSKVLELALEIVANGTSKEASAGVPIAGMVNTLALLVQMENMLSGAVLDSMMTWSNRLKEAEVAGRPMS